MLRHKLSWAFFPLDMGFFPTKLTRLGGWQQPTEGAYEHDRHNCEGFGYRPSKAFVASASSGAIAGNWGQNHPRREQVNDRLQNQNRRINRERQEGEITQRQANQLHREDRE